MKYRASVITKWLKRLPKLQIGKEEMPKCPERVALLSKPMNRREK